MQRAAFPEGRCGGLPDQAGQFQAGEVMGAGAGLVQGQEGPHVRSGVPLDGHDPREHPWLSGVEAAPEEVEGLRPAIRVEALDQQIDYALAAKTQAPDDVTVGGRVVTQNGWLPSGGQLPGAEFQVVLQTSSADGPDGPAVGQQEHPSPRSPIRRPIDPHDGGKHGGPAVP